MKKGAIIFLLAFTIIAIFSINQCCSAQDFKIDKVVEIGPADWVPFLGPIRWSPDGAKISYFSQGYLMISDTLGNTRQVRQAEIMPYRQEWVSNNELALYMWQSNSGDRRDKLIVYNFNNNSERTLVDTAIKHSGPGEDIDYSGVYLSCEGAIYYRLAIVHQGIKTEHHFIIAPSGVEIDTTAILAANHFYRWGEDGLYKIPLNLKDSLRVGRKPSSNSFIIDISPDENYAIDGGTIERLSDSVYIVLDTFPYERPTGTKHCTFSFPSFSGNSLEIALTMGCDYDENNTANDACIFNLQTKKIISIGKLANLPNGTGSVFSPDDKKIALISNGRLYVVFREGI